MKSDNYLQLLVAERHLQEMTDKEFKNTLKYYAKLYHSEQLEQSKDSVVQEVKELFDKRSNVGLKKYGKTLQENNTDNFYNHLQEELMDAVLYLQKIKKLRN